MNPIDKVVNKNIVLCFDGTGAEFGNKPSTNVLKLFKLLEKDTLKQSCYYQPGIGVEFNNENLDFFDDGFLKSRYHKLLNSVDAIIAFSLEKHVVGAYSYLCKTYNPGDKVFLFGFSRGSFTARVLTGMIERVGLLYKELEYMTQVAWEMYINWEYAGQPDPDEPKVSLINEFSSTFTRDKFEFEFMGLWDSVNSVGIIVDKLFPFVTTTSIVNHVRHALSIDERRAKFKQLAIQSYQGPECHDSGKSKEDNYESNSIELISSSVFTFISRLANQRFSRTKKPINRCSKDIIEMWFPGDHSDCGGGWPRDTGGGCLADVSLRWIVYQAVKFGVKFKPGSITQLNETKPILSSLLSYHHDVLSFDDSKNETNSIVDIIPEQPISRFNGRNHYSLFKTVTWWAMELLPVQYKYEDENREWRRGFEPNLGKHRVIPPSCLIHWSFFYRMHFIKDYEPNPNINSELYGKYMLESLKPFKHLYKGQQVEKYCQGLTKEQIISDFDSNIWNIIPNELQICLDEDGTL